MAPKLTDIPAENPAVPGVVRPEEHELARKRDEHAAIETELAERELRAANLRAEVGAFERQFLHHVGLLYAELDEWKARIAERSATQQPANTRRQKTAQEARGRAEETKQSVGEKQSEEPKAFAASPEMKKIYREVARRVHPDLTSDRADRARRQLLMAEANQAYECGDESKLNKILAEYECSAEAVTGEGAGAELVRVIRRISQGRSRLAEIEAELQELLRSDMYQLKLRVEEAAQSGRDVLRELKAKVESQIADAKGRWREESAGTQGPQIQA